jgi:hypothetical protein
MNTDRGLIITLINRHAPGEIRGWHDGSRAGFSTDPRRAKLFQTRAEACLALEELRLRFPQQALYVRPQAEPWTKVITWAFAAGLVLASLAGCSHQPLSATDCGRHATGGSGLLGLMAAAGAFDRDAGPECSLSGYVAASQTPNYIPSNDVWIPAIPAMPPNQTPEASDLLPTIFVPQRGSGTLVGVGGSGAGQVMVPAGSGTYMAMP